MSNEIKYVNEAGVRRIITDTRDHMTDVSEAAYTGHSVVLNWPADDSSNHTLHTTADLKPYGSVSISGTAGQSCQFTLPFQIPDSYMPILRWHIRGRAYTYFGGQLPATIPYTIDGVSRTIYFTNRSFSQSIDLDDAVDLNIIQEINTTYTYKIGALDRKVTYYATGHIGSTSGDTVEVPIIVNIDYVGLSIRFTASSLEVSALSGVSNAASIRKIGDTTYSIGSSPISPSTAYLTMYEDRPSYASYNNYTLSSSAVIIDMIKKVDTTGWKYNTTE